MEWITFETFSQDVIAFVGKHQVWAAPVVFALAFGESLAFISLLLPAWGALVAMGALISLGEISFVPVWVAGSLGAALGDWLSYWFGLKFKDSIRTMWPLSRHPEMIPKGEAFIERFGMLAIFIGRFFGPLRAAVPLVAGILAMPYWRFQFANFTSAFIWAAVLLTLGDLTSKVIKWTLDLINWM
jgi:membrane protein DedA with SNARE-associated domain